MAHRWYSIAVCLLLCIIHKPVTGSSSTVETIEASTVEWSSTPVDSNTVAINATETPMVTSSVYENPSQQNSDTFANGTFELVYSGLSLTGWNVNMSVAENNTLVHDEFFDLINSTAAALYPDPANITIEDIIINDNNITVEIFIAIHHKSGVNAGPHLVETLIDLSEKTSTMIDGQDIGSADIYVLNDSYGSDNGSFEISPCEFLDIISSCPQDYVCSNASGVECVLEEIASSSVYESESMNSTSEYIGSSANENMTESMETSLGSDVNDNMTTSVETVASTIDVSSTQVQPSPSDIANDTGSTPVESSSMEDGSSTPVESSSMESGSSTPVESSSMESGSSTPVESSSMESGSSTPVESSSMESGSSTPVESSSMESGSSTPVESSSMESGSSTPVESSSMESGSSTPVESSSMGSGSSTPVESSSMESGSSTPVESSSMESGSSTPVESSSMESGSSTPVESSSMESGSSTPVESSSMESGSSTPVESSSMESGSSTPVESSSMESGSSTPVESSSMESGSSTPVESSYMESGSSTPVESSSMESGSSTPVESSSMESGSSTPVESSSMESGSSTPVESSSMESGSSTPVESSSMESGSSTPVESSTAQVESSATSTVESSSSNVNATEVIETSGSSVEATQTLNVTETSQTVAVNETATSQVVESSQASQSSSESDVSSIAPTSTSAVDQVSSSVVEETTTAATTTTHNPNSPQKALYPYGSALGDFVIDIQNGPGVSKRIDFLIDVPFGADGVQECYVMFNGVISFGNDNAYPEQPHFKNAQTSTKKYIAAFWSRMSKYEKGTAFYHLYELDQDSTDDTIAIINRASEEVQTNYNLPLFKASTVLVATWDKVMPERATSWVCQSYPQDTTRYASMEAIYNKYCVDGANTQQNTFQAVLISDGLKSFILIRYKYGNMNWKYTAGRDIEIGVINGDKSVNFDVKGSHITTTLDTDEGSHGEPGAYLLQIGEIQSAAADCRNFVLSKLEEPKQLEFRTQVGTLLECSCTLGRLSRRWSYESGFEIEDDNFAICYSIGNVAKRRLNRIFGTTLNKRCCYEMKVKPRMRFWEWYVAYLTASFIPIGKFGGRVLSGDPWRWRDTYRSYIEENMKPWNDCCVRSDNCYLLDLVREPVGCSNVPSFVNARALGDPHITTLDGLQYTMNGWGEYNLVILPLDDGTNNNFVLQGRTERALSKGVLSNATVFSGFAAKEGGGTFQALLDANKTAMFLWANGIPIDTAFYKDENYKKDFNDVVEVSRDMNGDLINVVASFPSGVSLKISVGLQNLDFSVTVPVSFNGKTKGMMGNNNGNKEDEFILPSGNAVNFGGERTERKIFMDFAIYWQVTKANTVFNYQDGKNAADYRHDDFEPLFREEQDPVKLAEAVKLCGEKADACIFDYLATGDESFASATNSSSSQAEKENSDLANNLPTLEIRENQLSASSRWNLKHSEQASINFDSTDADSDVITYQIIGDTTGQTIAINDSGTLTFTPDLTKPISFSIQSKDTKDGVSNMIKIPISLCTGCNNQGECDTAVRPSSTPDFVLFKCICKPAYIGADCETDFDGCANDPCLEGQDCTDIPAVAQKDDDLLGYTCGPCPTGFEEKPDKRCGDIDECDIEDTCDSNAVCLNNDGSFFCECNAGYRQDPNDDTKCTDVDECNEKSAGCQQKCTNIPGSFNCSCEDAYVLNADKLNCDKGNNFPVACNACSQSCDTSNTPTCTCNAGYKVASNDPSACDDINECTEGISPCTQNCNNLVGSFNCSCFKGFMLDREGRRCEPCQRPFYGENCVSKCLCNGKGTCDNVRGCICNDGWEGTGCNTDVNECDDPTKCPVGESCNNLPGSYECLCPDGFKRVGLKCEDIIECDDGLLHTCDLSVQECKNTVGSYRCPCVEGFAKNADGVCEDIDECSLNIDKCDSICENVIGSYNCKCFFGSRLESDRISCAQVSDICKEQSNLTCAHQCEVDRDANTAECACNSGYALIGDQNCEDVNECNFDHLNLCEAKETCENNAGGFECSCLAGSKLENDGLSCSECTGGTWGIECKNDCACGLNAVSCDTKLGCRCKAGFKGTKCEDDIDECNTGLSDCAGSQTCKNIPGSFRCECPAGFTKSGADCIDINECETGDNNCGQVCSNIPGSFECNCYSGYTFSNDKCLDVDECDASSSPCTQVCNNLPGKFECSCRDGYKLEEDGTSCEATSKCKAVNTCAETCAMINGAEVCSCPLGKILNSDNVNCDDVDLCQGSSCEDLCRENGDNTTAVCSCNIGFKLDLNGFNCTECPEGKYGQECATECSCRQATTNSCDKTSGTCDCKPGYEGTTCETDTDECKGAHNCHANSQCSNTPGSFTCKCNPGYFTNSSTCVECEENFYGVECANACDCDTSHSTCKRTDGNCNCEDGWTGTRCDTDEDECLASNNCTIAQRQNWVCKNIPGSYTCKCKEGYDDKNDVCVDFNECATTFTNECDQHCDNTQGSYTCSCNSGYTKDDKKCVDNNECLASNGGCQHVCNNEPGTFACSCNTGHLLEDDNKSCLKIQEYSVVLTFDTTIQGLIFDATHPVYIKVKADIESELYKEWKKTLKHLHSVKVINMNKGSLIVDANAILDTSTDPDQTGDFIVALQELAKTNITIDGKPTIPIVVADGKVVNDSIDHCELMESFTPCDNSSNCEVKDGKATCVGGDEDDDDEDIPLIVGLSVGIPLLVIAIILIVVVIYFKTKNKELVRVASREGHYNENISRPASAKSNNGLLMNPE